MNKIINLLSVFYFIALVAASCETEPILELSQTSFIFSDQGSSQTISFSSNKDWSASVSGGTWCTISPASGSSDVKSITVSVTANDTYDDRSATVTITTEDLTKVITINQPKNKAIIILKKAENLSSDSHTLEIEFKTNVDFEIIIPESAKSWVFYNDTKALRTEKLLLNIAANKSNKARSTEIYIKDKTTSLRDTIVISQDEQNVYWVKEMGTLGTILNQTQKDTISRMIIKGEINKADFEVMKKQMPKLTYLDLKDVRCEGDKIPYEAFGSLSISSSNIYIKTIILPLSIHTIEIHAFSFCKGLTGTLNLPAGLKRIEPSVFYGCSGFTGSLTLPAGLIAIGGSAFSGCSGFTGSLTLPTGLTVIGNAAFSQCSGFNGSLNLPAGLKATGSSVFSGCSGFTGSLNLPVGLKKIELWAFYGCSGFTGSLNLPAGLTEIEGYAFSQCSGFTGSLTLPDGLTTIGERAFESCKGLTGLVIGNSLTTIYESAFNNCNNISGKVIFPITLSSIGKFGFYVCRKVNAFRFTRTTPILYSLGMLPEEATVEVPASAIAIYKATDGWRGRNIVGY